MPVHDWTIVESGIFHSFHVGWIPEINRVLNNGLLPPGFYALAEQHAGENIADVLTLHASSAKQPAPLPPLPDQGGTAVAEAPPRTRRSAVLDNTLLARRRSVAIRHVSDHRLVALLEVVSPGNKDRPSSLADFAGKAVSALEAGVHLLVLDLFPPGRHDPYGIPGAIRQRLAEAIEPIADEDGGPPPGEPVTLAAYAAGRLVDAYIEHAAVGAPLPDMPLFLHPDRYVNVPLERTYQAAYSGMPAYWRDVLEGRTQHGS